MKDFAVLKYEIECCRKAVKALRITRGMTDYKGQLRYLRVIWDIVRPFQVSAQKQGKPMRLAVRMLIEIIFSQLPSQRKGRVL